MSKVAMIKTTRSAAYKALKAEYDRYREHNSADLRELNELRREVWNLRKEQREQAQLKGSKMYAENIKLLAELHKYQGALEEIANTFEGLTLPAHSLRSLKIAQKALGVGLEEEYARH